MISNILGTNRKMTADIVEIERTAVAHMVAYQPYGPGKRISKLDALLDRQSRFVATGVMPLL